MLEEIRLSNFQGFSDETKIPLAPLTLIFGPNSSGKTSLIRSLLLLQQSFWWSSASTRPDFLFSDRNGVDLGSFANTVHKHDQSKEIVFRIGIAPGEKAVSDTAEVWLDSAEISVNSESSISRLKLFGGFEKQSKDAEYFHLEFVPEKGRRQEPDSEFSDRDFGLSRWRLTAESEKKFREISIHTPQNQGYSPHRRRETFDLKESIKGLGEEFNEELVDKIIEIRELPLKWQMGMGITPRLGRPSLGPIRSLFEDENQANRAAIFTRNIAFSDFIALSDLIDSFGSSLMRRFSSTKMLHVEAMRPIPERLEIGAGDASRHVNSEESMDRVSKWVTDLTDGNYELDYITMSGELVDLVGKSGTLVLKDKKLNTTVTFQDVGVGLSQVLPVLRVLDLLGSKRSSRNRPKLRQFEENAPSTILLEQPELHLHPRMQGKLMEILVGYLAEPGAAQIIAETHSESMVLKVQSEVSEGRLSADSVSILYVWKDAEFGNTRVKRLSLTDKGEFIDDWPESFSKIRLDQMRGE